MASALSSVAGKAGLIDAPAPDPGLPVFRKGITLMDADSLAPLNAGKCVGDTKPNAVQPPQPIEFIHFGYVHYSMENLFKHPKYPGDQSEPPPAKAKAGSSADDDASQQQQTSSEGSSGNQSELKKNPLFVKQAEKNKADWLEQIDPDPKDGGLSLAAKKAPPKKNAGQDDSSSSDDDEAAAPVADEEPAKQRPGPAGQAVLMRDALLRESLLLRGFIGSTIKVYEKWKENQIIPPLRAPDARALKHTQKKVAEAAQEINSDEVAYPKVHKAGLEFNRARADYSDLCTGKIEPYHGKPLAGLDQFLPKDVEGVEYIKPLLFMTLNTYGVFYNIHLGLRREYEPYIEEVCSRFSLKTIKAYSEQTYDIWFDAKGDTSGKDGDKSSGDPPGKAYVSEILKAMLPDDEPKPEGDAEKKSDNEKESSSKSDSPKDGAKKKSDSKEEESEEVAPPPSAVDLVLKAMATASNVKALPQPLQWWVTVWTKFDLRQIDKVYQKLISQSAEDREKEIDDAFVRETIGADTAAKVAKAADAVFELLLAIYAAAKACERGVKDWDKARKAGVDFDKPDYLPDDTKEPAGEPAEPEEGDEQPKKKKPGLWKGLSALRGKGDDDDDEKQDDGKKSEEKPADAAEHEDADEEKKDTEDDEEEDDDKVIARLKLHRDDIKSALEKLNEITMKEMAEILEEGRKEAVDAEALTMEVHLARLPRLTALLVTNTTIIAWKLMLAGMFSIIMRELPSEIRDEVGTAQAAGKIAGAAGISEKTQKDVKQAGSDLKDAGDEALAAAKGFLKKEESKPAFPPKKRVASGAGLTIEKSDRSDAADQVNTLDGLKHKADTPSDVFLKVT